MALITTNYIGDMSATNGSNNPEGGDTRRDGDDNMRNIQGTIKRTFPNFGSPSKAVTPTEDELNTLAGVSTTDPIITLPVGTPMLFYLDVAPPTWAILTVLDEHSVTITQGSANTGITGGTTGGTNDFSAQFTTVNASDEALTVAQMPIHDHTMNAHSHLLSATSLGTFTGFQSGSTFASTGDSTGDQFMRNGTDNAFVSGIVQSETSTMQTSGSGDTHNHTVDLNVKWAACIMAEKL